ncbi:MAG: hypothetical protein YFSK_1610 [Candidatus Yanofskyibacterium parasiticum]|jgi:arginine exporter protein ArgO|nr:MAG: hypothetical protein YFSK_1610 [Candidatus Yanofskybacteria bacterium]
MKNFIANNWFKILAGLILLGGLANNPYSYYTFLRWAVMIAAAYSAYQSYEGGKSGWTWIMGIIAILFNPIAPFYMNRDTWQLIDLVVAVIFFASAFQKKPNENKH